MDRKYKESGIEWIGKIPESWEVTRMKFLGAYLNGFAFKPEDWSSEGLPIIRIQDLSGSNDCPNYYKGVIDNKYLIHKGDILISWAATLDTFVWEKEDGWLNQHIFKADIYPNTNKRFFYWLAKMAMLNMNNDNKHGIFMQHVTTGTFNNFRVPLPSLSEQQRIADYLDKKCGEIDSLIVLQEKMIEKLKAYKQSVITEAVTKGLDTNAYLVPSGIGWIGGIPEGWNIIRIKNLLKERKERSETGKEEPLSMSQKFGLIPTKDMDMIPNMASSFVGAKVVYKSDLVFNKLKAHLGVFSVSKYYGLVSPDYAVYYSTGRADLKYLEYLFKTPQCIGEFRKRSTGVGAGLTRLYTDDLYSILIPFPALQEQHNIAIYLDEKCADIDRLIALKQQKIDTLNEYKKSLIYEAVTGKIDLTA